MSAAASSASWRGTPVIALASVFFSTMAVLARLASTELASSQLVVMRTAIGLFGCGVVFVLRRRGLDVRRWKLLMARGVFGATGVLGYFYAIEHLGAGPATVLNYCSPLYAAVFAAVFLGERPTRFMVLGLVVASVGAMLVALSSASTDTQLNVVPALVGLLAGVAGGAALTTMKAVREDTDAVTVFFFLCLFGLISALPLALPHWKPVEGHVVWLVLGVGVTAFIAQLMLTFGMGHTTATAAGAAIQLTPLFSWLIGVVVLHEAATAMGITGACLCMVGVVLGQARRSRQVQPG